jgi:hypothetical protein
LLFFKTFHASSARLHKFSTICEQLKKKKFFYCSFLQFFLFHRLPTNKLNSTVNLSLTKHRFVSINFHQTPKKKTFSHVCSRKNSFSIFSEGKTIACDRKRKTSLTHHLCKFTIPWRKFMMSVESLRKALCTLAKRLKLRTRNFFMASQAPWTLVLKFSFEANRELKFETILRSRVEWEKLWENDNEIQLKSCLRIMKESEEKCMEKLDEKSGQRTEI